MSTSVNLTPVNGPLTFRLEPTNDRWAVGHYVGPQLVVSRQFDTESQARDYKRLVEIQARANTRGPV